jgi:hypothetical protein
MVSTGKQIGIQDRRHKDICIAFRIRGINDIG